MITILYEQLPELVKELAGSICDNPIAVQFNKRNNIAFITKDNKRVSIKGERCLNCKWYNKGDNAIILTFKRVIAIDLKNNEYDIRHNIPSTGSEQNDVI